MSPKRWVALAVVLIIGMVLVVRAGRKRPQPLPGLGGVALSVAYAPDGGLVCTSLNGMVQKWMPQTQKWRSFMRPSSGYSFGPYLPSGLFFSPNGEVLFAGGAWPSGFGSTLSETSSAAWSSGTRRPLYSFNRATTFAVSRDGQFAAFGTEFRGVRICAIGTRARPAPQRAQNPSGSFASKTLNLEKFFLPTSVVQISRPCSLDFSPDGAQIVIASGVAGAAGTGITSAAIFDVRTGYFVRSLPSLGAPPGTMPGTPTMSAPSVAWSPDGKFVALCDGEMIGLWDVQSNRSIGPVALGAPTAPPAVGIVMGSSLIRPLAFSPDSKRLAAGGPDVRLLSIPELEEERKLDASGGVAFSPDGSTLATGHHTVRAVLEWKL